METPVFEEIEPGADCECPGCVHWRLVMPYSAQYAHLSHPAARTARSALVVATAAGAALGAGHAVPAVAAAHGPAHPGGVPTGEGPDTPQGKKAPLHGPGGRPADEEKPPKEVLTPPTTRAEIIRRAKTWIAAEVPYSMREYWSDGYRQDCSGFVSMAWGLTDNEWTGSLDKFAQRISKDRLEPGDMLLFHNPKDPRKGSHVVIFGGWTDYAETHYIAYESARPYARRQATPYGYWDNATHYVPYRYKGLIDDGAGRPDEETAASGGSGSPVAPPGKPGKPERPQRPGAKGAAGPGSDRFPGREVFGPGAHNKYVARLGQMLVQRGGARFYTGGPGPIWSDADRRATRAFQRAQGWSGRSADGIPGPLTWSYLVTGRGKNIAAAGNPGPPGKPAAPRPSVAHRPPVVHRPPGNPGEPGASGTSGASGKPAPPGVSGKPATSGKHTPPGVSGKPATPGEPTPPGGPVSPGGPDLPGGPVTPVTPVTPGAPKAPRAPRAPGIPVTPASHGVLGYPGRGMFRPGADNAYVTQLGKQLVKKGFGKYYTSSPGPRWGESDRRNVEAFQRAQGWRGGAADGYPGPETWRRLFA
ncbi:peptidoglycan-binding protein [Streptomyces europaeiscabiei]|uniref:peptidoglycan-binding protein n=1 Tax=Streptomyces europaeiscabiei TaxID=146819 RepID=UPI0029B55F3F|nr:peptidoglycan-binding protein [Streptomyces europaeiscabiei]MDX2764657.1 peptidoglycan-binding protein [Streptomyces europaeiscabiei]